MQEDRVIGKGLQRKIIIYCGLIFVGAVTEVKTVWDYADTMNGLQIFPNLIALIVLAPQVASATRNYFNRSTPK